MQLEAARLPARESRRFMRLVLTAWALALGVVCVRTVLQPRQHSCYPIFAGAARHWLAGAELYYKSKPLPGQLDDFRYSPPIAAMLTPFVLFPDSMGGVLWRLLNAGALVGGMFWCVRAVFPHLLRRSELALFFLLVLPLAVGNFNNGQANPLVLGLVLSTLAAVAESRWNLAALCMVLACLLKVYPIALGMVLAILYLRQFAGRLTIALAAGLILPFLFQHADYVRMQYAEWLACLLGDDRHARPLDTCYRDFQLICRVWFVPLSPLVYRVFEAVAGAGIAALCLMGRRADWPEIRLLSFLLGLVCCWMTVFGPATESATYILLAPSLTYAVIEAWAFRSSAWLRGLLMGNYGLLVIAQMEAWFSGGGLLRSHGLQPLAGLLFLVNLLLAHFLKAKAVAGQPTTLLATSAAAA